MDRKVPLGFGGLSSILGIELNTGKLSAGSWWGAGRGGIQPPGVEFNPFPGTKNQEPKFPEKHCGNLGSWGPEAEFNLQRLSSTSRG